MLRQSVQIYVVDIGITTQTTNVGMLEMNETILTLISKNTL